MPRRADNGGFILPYALLLGTALLAAGVLLLDSQQNQAERAARAARRQRAETLLRLQVRPLVERLETVLLEQQACSALVPEGEPGVGRHRPVALVDGSPTEIPLHGGTAPIPADAMAFPALADGRLLCSAWLPLADPGVHGQLEWAWAAEDASLLEPAAPPPPFWPLPAWNLAPAGDPAQEQAQRDAFMEQAGGAAWRTLPWAPPGAPLEADFALAPALVPVVNGLALRIGIFATGPESSREKVVRVRYYLEGELWNPYNRALVLHGGTTLRAVFQVIFHNLPEVRIWNRSMGLNSGWISLDNAVNPATGERGLHGWVRTPGRLAAGQRWAFLEPDPVRQPEGLARTLHPAFMAGPADRIEIEFRVPSGGLHATCLPLASSDPAAAAAAGEGWFRLEAFPQAWPALVFPRGDAGPRPFVLPASLQFRIDNTHLRIAFTRTEPPHRLDPRRRRIHYAESREDAAGVQISGGDLVRLAVAGPEAWSTGFPAFSSGTATPLFSWPATPPASLLSFSDMPHWEEGYRIGAAGASRLNGLLEHAWAWPEADPEEVVVLHLPDGTPLPYRPTHPVNCLAPPAWEALLQRSARVTDPAPLAFCAYPETLAANPDDWRPLTRAALADAATRLAQAVAAAPSRSVAGFFDRGLLAAALPSAIPDDPVHPLLPLRGWLRAGPPLARHGSAWLLHLAVRSTSPQFPFLIRARAWLLQTAPPGQPPRLLLVHFQWLEP